MGAYELWNIVAFANRDGNGDPPKRERLHQVCCRAATAHARDEHIAYVAAWPHQVNGLSNFYGIGQLASKCFDQFPHS